MIYACALVAYIVTLGTVFLWADRKRQFELMNHEQSMKALPTPDVEIQLEIEKEKTKQAEVELASRKELYRKR